VARLSGLRLTRGFADPPHDGGALYREGSFAAARNCMGVAKGVSPFRTA